MTDTDSRSTLLLSARRALVIGAGTPAGSIIAVALADAGADVAVAAGSIDGAEVMAVRRVRRAIEALGRRTAEYAMDLTLGANIRVSTRQVTKEMGGLDILVNAADAYLLKDAEAVSDAEWSRLMSINLNGVFYACRAAIKEMTAGGVVVNVCPWPDAEAVPGISAYVASRHGVVGLTRALASEFAPRGIRFHALLLDAAVEGSSTAFAPLPFTGDAGRLVGAIVQLASAAPDNEVICRLTSPPGNEEGGSQE